MANFSAMTPEFSHDEEKNITDSEFGISVINTTKNILVCCTEEPIILLVQPRENRTRITLFDSIEEEKNFIGNSNSIENAVTITETEATKYKLSFTVNTENLNEFIRTANLITELTKTVLEFCEFCESDDILKIINLLSKKYAPEYILQTLQSLSSNELLDLIYANDPVWEFEWLISDI